VLSFYPKYKMIDIPVLITGLVSVLTLALSRCRCIVRSTPEGHTQWGIGFSDAQLFPSQPPEPAPPRPSTPDPSHV
jgi:hypothetical protein